jgi:hypothetical protein
MATIKTALTPLGYKTLMKKGLVNEIVYYNMNDNYHNYLVTAKESLVPEITGGHNQITTSESAFANYDGLFVTTPTLSEIENTTSRVKVEFIKEQCYYEFNQSNLNMIVNINPWLNQLSNLTYSPNMQGLTLNLWDYIMVTKQSLNVSTKNYDDVKFITNLNVGWVPKTDFDIQTLQLLSPRFVKKLGTKKEMVDNTTVKNASPFLLSFSTYTVNGNAIHNMAGRFSLVTNNFGYWVDNNKFLTTTELETSDISTYSKIYPASKIGNEIYYLPKNVAYPTSEGFVGYAVNMVNVDGSGKKLITAMVEQAILFMKTYGTYNSLDNTYTLTVNLSTTVFNQEVNSITTKYGGNITINFVYNPSDITSSVINLI